MIFLRRKKPIKTGLIMTGGGARAAYQAGVLRALSEICRDMGMSEHSPFKVISGTSAGAINAGFLGCNSHHFINATRQLCDLWGTVHSEKVYRVDSVSIAKSAIKSLFQLSAGGAISGDSSRSLLDTAPLRQLIEQHMCFDQLNQNIESKVIDAIAITAINYISGASRIFFQEREGLPSWQRAKRKGEFAHLAADHIMASTAIPLLFPPVKVDGHYFGDGSLRNHTPLSPAIQLGAQKILVIGVRKLVTKEYEDVSSHPSLARILSVLLNTMLLDAIDMDYERMSRINDLLYLVRPKKKTKLKPISVCMLRPSRDLGEIAVQTSAEMPTLIKYMLKGLGTKTEASDLISYLLFEPRFTNTLIELGYEDTMSKAETLRLFFQQDQL